MSSKKFQYKVGDILYDKVYNEQIKILKTGTYEMYKDDINKSRIIMFNEDPNSIWYYIAFINKKNEEYSNEWLREKEINII